MKEDRAFTLLEVLVASAVTVVLAGSLVSVAVAVLGGWKRSTGTLSAGSQAGIVLDQLTQDLEALVMRHDENVWFAATVQTDQSGPGDAAMSGSDWPERSKPRGAGSLRLASGVERIEQMRFGQAGLWLRFFAVQPDSNESAGNRSVARAIAYQIVRRQVGDRYAYQLYRSQVRPGGANSTFSAGYDLLSSSYTTGNGLEQHPGNVRRPNARFLLGNHVIDFGCRIHEMGTAGGRVLVFPVSDDPGQSAIVSRNSEAQPPGYEGRPVIRVVPASVEMMVRILTEEGAQLVWNLESGRINPPPGMNFDDYWWELAEAHSRVFTRRIEVKSQPF